MVISLHGNTTGKQHGGTYTILDLKNIYQKNKWGMTIGQNLWNPRVNSHHISWEFLMLMFLICKTKAQMQGSLSHLAGFLQCLRKILDVDPQKIYGSIGLDTSPHRYGSSQIGPHLQVNIATMSVVCGYQNSLTCAHSAGEHVAAVWETSSPKKNRWASNVKTSPTWGLVLQPQNNLDSSVSWTSSSNSLQPPSLVATHG